MFSRYHQNSQWLYANSFSLISQCPVGKALCCEVLRPFDWCTACVEYIWGLSGLLCYLNWCAIKALVVVNIRLMLPYFSLWLNAELVFFLLYRLRWHVCVKRRGWFERSVHYTYRRGVIVQCCSWQIEGRLERSAARFLDLVSFLHLREDLDLFILTDQT